MKLRLSLVALVASAVTSVAAATPPAQKLLPPDTLALLSVPDYTQALANKKHDPVCLLWDDPALRPFRDHLTAKFQSEVLDKIEKETGIKLAEYADLLQGQLSLAITRNGWSGTVDPLPGFVLVLDARDKADQLKAKLAEVRKKITDAGKTLKTDKIRDTEFTTLALDEGAKEGGDAKAPKLSLSFGQVGSVLVAGTATRDLERVVGCLGSASMPNLAEEATFDADYQAFFRDASVFGWINFSPLAEVITKVASAEQSQNSMGPKPDAILTAVGLKGLKTLAFGVRGSPEGNYVTANLNAPWQERKGLLKLLATEGKDAGIPDFVPVEAAGFWRWRLDGQKFWGSIEATVNEIAPGTIGFLITQLETTIKEKDASFDFKRSFIMNLGDDLIGYQKPAKSSAPADLLAQPSLFLLGSPNAEQLVGSLRSLVGMIPGPDGTLQFKDREFLGRHIYSLALPDMTGSGKQSQIHMAGSGGYAAFAADSGILEEYLRSSETKPKPLAELPGLKSAAEKVGGMGTGLFGFQNDTEQLRPFWEALRTNKSLFFDLMTAQNPALNGALGDKREEFEKQLAEWADFALLPPFEKVAKYFHFTVYAGKASNAGYNLKAFTPVSPQMQP